MRRPIMKILVPLALFAGLTVTAVPVATEAMQRPAVHVTAVKEVGASRATPAAFAAAK